MGKTGYKLSYLYIIIFIPIITSCVSKAPVELTSIQKNRLILESTGFTQVEPALMEGVKWSYPYSYSNEVEFDVEITHSINPPIDWITIDRTTNYKGYYNVEYNPTYFRVGAHWTNELMHMTND